MAAAERLGPYTLVRQLGEGGMARIYLATDERNGGRVALKRLHASHFEDRLTVGRFLREARVVADIRHPNLVAVSDVVEEPNEVYLVMEYLDGRDLAQVLGEEGPLAPKRAARLMAEACDGLFEVHSRGIVHRDLKPENLFLAVESGGKERVKLLDFGVARLLEDKQRDLKTKTGQTVGTPMYMSPEQATASPIDARSDIYMMGVVLFELITGTPPFVGTGYGDVMMMHVNDPPPRLLSRRPDVPPWIDEVVMRCLEKEPDARFQTAAELAAALRGTPGALDTTSRMPLAPIELKRGFSTRTSAMVLAGATMVALAIVIAVVTLSKRAEEQNLALPPQVAHRPQPAPPPTPPTPPPLPPAAARVHVVTVPEGAEIHLGGQPQCLAPCDVMVPHAVAGTVTLEAMMAGYGDERRQLDAATPPAEIRLTLHHHAASSHHGGGSNRNATVDPFSGGN